MKKPLGIYIHIPFCIKKCLYCDFCSYPGTDRAVKLAYVKALIRQISGWRDKCVGHTVDTVYFGGGTPTLLSLSDFEAIIGALRNTFDISDDCEITTECNPATADLQYFRGLHSLGVNRISIGIQSADDRELSALGRVHSWRDAESAFNEATEAGFGNISADLMFGIPGQTTDSFKRTLDSVTALSPSHVSAYSLIIEPGTPFSENRKNLALPDEDSEYTMYTDAVELLAQKGFFRYEISNFALTGRESRHNLKYWRREEYLGFGLSAHSFFGETRFFAPAGLDEYISGGYISGSEKISPNDAACEYVMLGMRLIQGVDEAAFRQIFGKSFGSLYAKPLQKFISAGFVVREGGRCAFTDRGFCVSNTVLSEILSFDSN